MLMKTEARKSDLFCNHKLYNHKIIFTAVKQNDKTKTWKHMNK